MKKHILLIEDDKIVRENTAEILGFANYRVTTASDGKIGIEKAINEKPDLIICDIMMPNLDGYGVYQILSKNKNFNCIPFIFLSARTNPTEIRKGMGLGADDYITKPFEESELLSAISTRLKKSSLFEKHFSENNEIIKKQTASIQVETIDELIDELLKRQTQIYQKGDSLYCEGNRSNHLFLVKKGHVKTYKSTEDGKELITGFYKKRNFIGYTSSLGDFSHSENAEAIEKTKVIKVAKKEIIAIIETNSHIALDLIELMAYNIKGTKEKLVQIAYDTVRRRTAKSILFLIADDPLNTIIISRADLASLTGIARETLIRTLSDFKDEGYIETSRTYVKVIDKKRLTQIH